MCSVTVEGCLGIKVVLQIVVYCSRVIIAGLVYWCYIGLQITALLVALEYLLEIGADVERVVPERTVYIAVVGCE